MACQEINKHVRYVRLLCNKICNQKNTRQDIKPYHVIRLKKSTSFFGAPFYYQKPAYLWVIKKAEIKDKAC